MTRKEKPIDCIADFKVDMMVKIEENWSLNRLFQYYRGKCKHTGESIILAHILDISKHKYSVRKIRRVIEKIFEEKIPIQARRWLYSKASDVNN